MNSKDAKVKNVSTAAGKLTVWVDDGRVLSLPLDWYPSLKSATPAERSRWRKSSAGYGIHWPALDYDLSVEGLLAGAKEARTILAQTRKTRARLQPVRTRRRPATRLDRKLTAV